MLKKYSLTKNLVGTQWISPGVIANADGSLSKAFWLNPVESGNLEEGFEGANSELFFSKLGDLLSRLPNGFEGQLILQRSKHLNGMLSKIYVFEKVAKPESYSHFRALLEEMGTVMHLTEKSDWLQLISSFLGGSILKGRLPDAIWERNSVKVDENVSRILSLTELPQVSWNGCLQPVFEFPGEVSFSIKISIPNREKIRRSLETKRRVSHAMAVASSLEVRNIESNSILSSSEETLERILVGKETLFDVSLGIVAHGDESATLDLANELERVVAGVGNAGIFLEGVGCLPVFKSHIPGNKTLGIRKLPVLSGNLVHLLPLVMDYSRSSDPSAVPLKSRCGEASNLNLFSKENLNFNSFICGASGSGKSFLMNALLAGALIDDPNLRLCIFDIGGSYRKIVSSRGGDCIALTISQSTSLIATFLKMAPVRPEGFFKSFVEILCGSGPHITHSHKVAIDDLLREFSGTYFSVRKIVQLAAKKEERYFHDLAHWLKPHLGFDDLDPSQELIDLIRAPIAAFDFKELEGDPVLQKATILLLSELIWRDLLEGKFPRTLIVFDEVWRFFAQSKEFLEEMYRTFRKYRAGIVSITQNLSDYGDDAFAKMLFTNSYTKLFLQNGAGAEYLRNTFDLGESDVARGISIGSKKPIYSEFFALTPKMSQVFRLYPSKEFYDLANTENVTQKN